MDQNVTAESLIGAATAALRQAYETDLPWVESLEVERGAEAALPQGDRRDLYAAKRLCNIQYGPLRLVRRRPSLSGLQTCIVPQGDGHRIVVLSCEGPVAVYALNGSLAKLERVLPHAADLAMDLRAAPAECCELA